MRERQGMTDEARPNAELDLYQMGSRIRARREEMGLTMLDVALAIGYGDVQPLSRIELGVRTCPTDRLYALSHILDLSVDYMFFGNERYKAAESVIRRLQTLDSKQMAWITTVIDLLIDNPSQEK